jgi:hypothetical protein
MVRYAKVLLRWELLLFEKDVLGDFIIFSDQVLAQDLHQNGVHFDHSFAEVQLALLYILLNKISALLQGVVLLSEELKETDLQLAVFHIPNDSIQMLSGLVYLLYLDSRIVACFSSGLTLLNLTLFTKS